MKKHRLFAAAALLLLLLCACGSESAKQQGGMNTLDGVWIELDSVTPTSADISIYNTTGRCYLSGYSFYTIEKMSGGSWRQLDFISESEYSYIAGMGLKIRPTDAQDGLSAVVPYAWERLYGQLDPGDYRVVMELQSENDYPRSANSPVYYLSAEFSVNA